MFKTLMVAVLAVVFLNSGIAIGADPITAEKWLCTRDVHKRVIRLYAPARGEAPCKVFYTKRTEEDPNDAQTEAKEAAGEIKPIYYSTGNGGFCVRMMDKFVQDKKDHEWSCVKEK